MMLGARGFDHLGVISRLHKVEKNLPLRALLEKLLQLMHNIMYQL